MKKTTKIFCLFILSSLGLFAQTNVTFKVNMNQSTMPVGSIPEVNGNFNGWCGSCAPMTDANSDGIWEKTISLAAGSYEYKFSYNNWAGQEMLIPGSACTITTGQYTSRTLTVGSTAMVLPTVCWNSCSACGVTPPPPPPTPQVTFKVDVSQSGLPVGAIPEVNGTFNSWCGNCNAMTDANADGIWETTILLNSGSYEYKFSYSTWTGQETLVPGSSCTITTGQNTIRTLTVGSAAMVLPTVCWNSCLACAPLTASVLSGDATICSGASTNLSVVVTGGTAPYTVTVTDGTNNYSATGASPVSIPVSPTTTSTYTIVSVTGGGGTGNTGTATVTVTPIPTATITALGPTTFCSGGNVVLTASGGTSYSWSNGSTSVGTGSTYTASTAGSYTLQVTDDNGCSSAASGETVVTVNALPSAVIVAGGATTFCLGGSVILHANPGQGDASTTSYLWSTGETTASKTATTTFNSSIPLYGSFTVQVTTNATGCTATSAAIVVTINPLPTATITALGPTTFCSGGNVVLTASGGTSYSWSNGSTSVGTGSTYTASTAGSYTLQVTDVNGCASLSAATVLTITPSFTNTTPISACDSYVWNGQTYTTSGVYTGTTTNCVTESLNLTITPAPAQPTIACYETATFNPTTCLWEILEEQVQAVQPTLSCWQTASFNTITCAWDVTGTQVPEPTGLSCWQTATFNTATCSWDVTGTQPTQPTLACYETATFNTTTCSWVISGPQAPQKMSYQAVIRNSNDSLLVSTQVGMRISLVQGTPTGTVVFSETQTATTNANGLVSLQIGMGTVVTGTFACIDWAAGPYYVKTETDLTGGTNYTIISSNELLSVPYALFSANGPTGAQGPAGPQGPQGTFPPGTVAGEMNYWNGTAWVTVAPGSYANPQTLTFCMGVPTWGPCPWSIGQSYQGGIVTYILQPGDIGYDASVPHGLIAAPSDQGYAPWGCYGTDISGADGTAIGTGNQNTIDIMNGCLTSGIAARLCGDLVLNGYSDWYLPSKDELHQLYKFYMNNRVAIGSFDYNYYWSSTESVSNFVWGHYFYDGYDFCVNKLVGIGGVRAVRAF